ncbi:MAG: DUF378 domain-containing protein [Chlamydiales bacterium]|nr:DUF378 domain-containing protein [Chlamydiales bacterium]
MNFLAFLLVIVGALNWGLWGFFQFDIVAWLLHGNTTWLSRLVYAIIGLAGVWTLRLIPKCRRMCCCGPECSCKGGKGGCCK